MVVAKGHECELAVRRDLSGATGSLHARVADARSPELSGVWMGRADAGSVGGGDRRGAHVDERTRVGPQGAHRVCLSGFPAHRFRHAVCNALAGAHARCAATRCKA